MKSRANINFLIRLCFITMNMNFRAGHKTIHYLETSKAKVEAPLVLVKLVITGKLVTDKSIS